MLRVELKQCDPVHIHDDSTSTHSIYTSSSPPGIKSSCGRDESARVRGVLREGSVGAVGWGEYTNGWNTKHQQLWEREHMRLCHDLPERRG